MSVILYGPQGSGKTTIANKLRARLKLRRVIEADSPDFPRNLYSQLRTPERALKLKAQNALFVTDEAPPPFVGTDNRRVMHIDQAKQLLGVA